MRSSPLFWLLGAVDLFMISAPARAWGYEGHEVIAAIARSYLTPTVRARVDTILATDTDTLTRPDMISRATWADAWRSAGHRETAAWHFVDNEIDHVDFGAACFGFPKSDMPASAGPAQDCVVDKIEEFAAELAGPATSDAERLLALKYVLHFVGDLHQPLHAADHQDRGGNCVSVGLGGSRTVNLHSWWDTGVVNALGSDPLALAASLARQITPDEKAIWRKGGPKDWAMESYGVARQVAYTIGSPAGCTSDAAPIALPAGYEEKAEAAATIQLERAGVRLALLLNRALKAPPG
ncbi:MAG: Nuclease [Sphingomonas bacterium]|nr:Nuclease [Sphingomonas bacterium]